MIAGSIKFGSGDRKPFSHINRAETFIERSRGLLGCTELEEGHGMLLSPCNSIHTFFMKIPLDIVFLGTDYRIISLSPYVRPWRLRLFFGASAVLELMAGQIRLSGLQTGEQLQWEPLA